MSKKSTSKKKRQNKVNVTGLKELMESSPTSQMTRAAMKNLVKGLLTGQSDTILVPIQLRIPRALYQTYQAVALQYGLPIEQALENLANTGIQKALNDSVKISPTSKDTGIEDLAKQHGIDLAPLTDGLGKISSLIGEMQKLQKAFAPDDTTGNDPKTE